MRQERLGGGGMSSSLVLIDCLGAGALLLWGLRMVKTGVQRAFGGRLRLWLAASTRNRLLAFSVGLVATLALQSSTATALMAAAFASRELINLAMGQAIMLGANVGTSLVAQIMALDVHWLASALMLPGVVMFLSSERNHWRGGGRALIGLGLMLLALGLLSHATQPMRESPVLLALLAVLDSVPLLALVIAAGLAFVASSSLAIVLLVMAMAATGALSASLCLVLVAGANVGGAIPPYLATLKDGYLARRLTLTNLAIRLAGALLVIALAQSLAATWQLYAGSSAARLVVDAHVGFNLALAVLFLPFVGPLSRLAARLVPKPLAQDLGPRYLDDSAMDTPAVALSSAARETLRIGDHIEQMLSGCLRALQQDDPRLCDEIARNDDRVDELHEAVKLYLSRLSRDGLEESEARRSTEIISYAINLEHVGDIIDKGLRDLAARKIKNRLHFSKEGFAEIEALFNRTLETLRTAQSVFLSRDMGLARKLVEDKVDLRHLERRSAERHLERLRAGRLETIQTSTLHLDALRDLKRINAHLISVAYPILDEVGALRESRLRSVSDTAMVPEQAAIASP